MIWYTERLGKCITSLQGCSENHFSTVKASRRLHDQRLVFSEDFSMASALQRRFFKKDRGDGDPSSVEPTEFVCWPTLFSTISTMHSWGRSIIERRLLELRQWIGLNEIELPIYIIKANLLCIWWHEDSIHVTTLAGCDKNELRWHNVSLMFASLYILIFGSSKIHPNVVRFTAWRFRREWNHTS